MVVYHSPSASDADFINFLVDIVEDFILKRECILIGDFNIDCMTDSFYTKKLLTIMNSMGMKQYVNEPTRITKESRSIIDLVFSNKKIETSVMSEPMITDHACLKIECPESKQKNNKMENKYNRYMTKDYRGFDVDRFLEILKDGLEYSKSMSVNKEAKRLIDNMIQPWMWWLQRERSKSLKLGTERLGSLEK